MTHPFGGVVFTKYTEFIGQSGVFPRQTNTLYLVLTIPTSELFQQFRVEVVNDRPTGTRSKN